MPMSEPSWKRNEDAENYTTLKEDMQVYQLCMALIDDFESVPSSLLHRYPSSSLDVVISQILSEKLDLLL